MRQCLLFILFASFLTNAFCEYVGYPMDTWIVPQPYSITSLACKDNLLLVGGDVLSVGPKTGHIAVYDRGTKKLRGNFPYVDGTVTNSVSDGSGGWFIAGDFTRIGCVERNGIAHIFGDGILDAQWNPIRFSGNTFYNMLQVSENAVFFNDINNILYAVSKFGSGDTLWELPLQTLYYYDVLHYSSYNNLLYLALHENICIGEACSLLNGRIYAIDAGAGDYTDLSIESNDFIYALYSKYDTLYIGGVFSSIAGLQRNGLASYDMASGQFTSWCPNDFSEVYDIQANSSCLYISGYLQSYYNYNITKFPFDTETRDPLFLRNATPFFVDDIDLYNFEAKRALHYTIPALMQSDPFNIFSFPVFFSIVSEPVYTISGNENSFLIGGGFISADGYVREGGAAIDLTTGLPTSYNPGCIIEDYLIQNDCFYAKNSNIVYKHSRDTGELMASFSVPGYFSSMVEISGKLYGISYNYKNTIAILDLSTNTYTISPWSFDKPPESLACIGDTLYAAGTFTSVNGVPRNYLAAFDTNTLELLDWTPSIVDNGTEPRCVMHLLANPEMGTIIAGGYFFFDSPSGYGSYIGVFDAISGDCAVQLELIPHEYSPHYYYDGIQSIALGDSTLYVSINRERIIAFDLTTGLLRPWFLENALPYGLLAASGDKLCIYQSYSSVNNYVPVFQMYRFREETETAAAHHSADLDGDGRITLTEALRIVQLFNLAGFHCAHYPTAESEDSYAPGISAECYDCPRHSADYRDPAWHFDIAELLRVIQFFNMGGYHVCPDAGTEDGYCPGGG